MARIMYDSSRYHEEEDKLPTPDGIHCIIPGCQNFLWSHQRKYCSDECFRRWYDPLVNDWAQVRAQVMKFDPNNCITLCVACHKIRHTRRSTPNNHTLADFIDAAPSSV